MSLRKSRNKAGRAIEQSVVDQAAAGLRDEHAQLDFFGPGQPMQPIAPSAEGRSFDYNFAINSIANKPRSQEAVTFDALRALADGYDILRIVIETRKDQMGALSWAISPKDKKLKTDARCAELEAFFKSPDRESTWDSWLRMLLEDMLVLDAPTLYRRKTNGGDLYALEPIDGATIKRLIDYSGRTPTDGAAYQQILKGVPAVDYTREELIYRPRNRRTNKIYGYSPVEQIIMTVNIALRRQMHTLEYYTAGTIPDALAGVPEDWTAEQIKQFQDYWDILMNSESETGIRRKMRFLPSESAKNYRETKQPPLKDMFDEWLTRVVCFAFSIEPTAFVAQVNRSVAETTREQSRTEGLAPIKNWVKSLIDEVIAFDFGYADLEFRWTDEEVIDAKTKADINSIYVNAKVLHPDEVRANLGLDPLTDEQKADMAPPVPMLAPPVEEQKKEEPADKVEKAAVKDERPIEVNVTLPTINVHQPDVLVEVAGTTVHAHIEAQPATVIPAPDVTVNVEPTPVTLEANIEAPNITVKAEAAPAQVTVKNEITAQAAPAQVVISHPEQSVAEHERDPQTQEILRTVTTHKQPKQE